jgi:5'/3'-nucleotidase SurE
VRSRAQQQRKVERADPAFAALRHQCQQRLSLCQWHPGRLCAHCAERLWDYRPDLVVSGINNGANMGDDTIYSGTVGAAMEGYLFGIPAIAFSQVERDWHHLDSAARKVRELVQSMQQQQIIGHTPFLLNVNIPNKPYDEIGSMKLCRLGRRHAAEKVIQQQSPRGETMYWIGAAGASQGRCRWHRFPRHGPGPCGHDPPESGSDRPRLT